MSIQLTDYRIFDTKRFENLENALKPNIFSHDDFLNWFVPYFYFIVDCHHYNNSIMKIIWEKSLLFGRFQAKMYYENTRIKRKSEKIKMFQAEKRKKNHQDNKWLRITGRYHLLNFVKINQFVYQLLLFFHVLYRV